MYHQSANDSAMQSDPSVLLQLNQPRLPDVAVPNALLDVDTTSNTLPSIMKPKKKKTKYNQRYFSPTVDPDPTSVHESNLLQLSSSHSIASASPLALDSPAYRSDSAKLPNFLSTSPLSATLPAPNLSHKPNQPAYVNPFTLNSAVRSTEANSNNNSLAIRLPPSPLLNGLSSNQPAVSAAPVSSISSSVNQILSLSNPTPSFYPSVFPGTSPAIITAGMFSPSLMDGSMAQSHDAFQVAKGNEGSHASEEDLPGDLTPALLSLANK
jgi:hypothetical protein